MHKDAKGKNWVADARIANPQPAWFVESQRWSQLCWLVKRVELLPVKVCWCGTETRNWATPFGSPAFSLENVPMVIVIFELISIVDDPLWTVISFANYVSLTMFHSESHLSAKGKGGVGSTLKITQNGRRGLAVFLHIFPRLLRTSAFSVRYPDLNRNHQRPVFAAGPQPPSSQRRYVGTNVRKNVRKNVRRKVRQIVRTDVRRCARKDIRKNVRS